MTGAYSPIEHTLLRLQLLSEVSARASSALVDDDLNAKPAASSSTSTKSAVEPVAMATNSSAADTATTAPTSTQAWAKGNPFDKQKVCWKFPFQFHFFFSIKQGTGYGFGAANSNWDVNAYLAAQAAQDAEIQTLVMFMFVFENLFILIELFI